MNTTEPERVAREAIAEIRRRFPALRMVEDSDAPIELSVSFPVQEGLKYKVWLALQNRDELHFAVEHFWLEWFPCQRPDRLAAYLEAVTSFLAGTARVLERYRGTKCVSADLQIEAGGAWRTVGSWSCLAWPIPWQVSTREVRNA